jgi:RNA polymerase sigma-70 factor (ECF subfamily)
MVVEVNRAVALGMARGAQIGLEMLLRLENQADGFYPFHAARADLLRRTGQREAASDAYQRALELCGNNAERAYLQRRLDELRNLNP